LNRRELINAVASHIDAESKEVDKVLGGFTDVVTSTVARGEQVAISGFAKFAKVERAARMGRNPATGEAIHIKASKKARITPLKAFKDAVMGGSAGAKKAGAKKSAAIKKVATKKAATTKTAATKRVGAKKATAKKAAKRR
jgi:DNA-binding protein HU-beta